MIPREDLPISVVVEFELIQSEYYSTFKIFAVFIGAFMLPDLVNIEVNLWVDKAL